MGELVSPSRKEELAIAPAATQPKVIAFAGLESVFWQEMHIFDRKDEFWLEERGDDFI